MTPGTMSSRTFYFFAVTILLAGCVNNPAKKATNLWQGDRSRLDSVFGENPRSLILLVNEDPTFKAFPTLKPKKITISKGLCITLRSFYKFEEDQPMIEAILSHEYAHITQYERNAEIFSEKNIAFRECQADFISAYYVSNKYRYEVMKKSEPTTDEIFYEIGNFVKNRQKYKEMYLMLAMLMNDNIEGTLNDAVLIKEEYGIAKDSLRIMRLASVWEGFTTSGILKFDEVYSRSLHRTRVRVQGKEKDKVAEIFQILGTETVEKILRGQCVTDEDITGIIKRIEADKVLINPSEKVLYSLAVRRFKGQCN
ncbi:hypothetical protein [Dyadobacter bucti]|uniref:hypothetical protein n=1 Tax=Dyadobacter bucti TaxID=2572203 RepID=UPI00110921A4|nr:hypothetical protein [Dyadobacter bucti]